MLLIELQTFSDDRGLFTETWREDQYIDAGIPQSFVQDNLSRSGCGVLRGLHYQIEHPQGHLVTVSRGAIFDVGVDLRRDSPAFGNWVGMELSGHRLSQIYLPPGIAHGFCVISESAELLYKCTDYYYPGDEGGLLWSDSDLGIRWPVPEPIVSDRDCVLPRLKDISESRLPQIGYK